MPQWRAQSSPIAIAASGASEYYSIWGDRDSATEADTQMKAYTGFTFSDLRVQCTNLNGGNSSSTFRDDGVSSTNIVISISSAAWFEDVTGSDAVAADSLVNILLEELNGMHDNTVTVRDSLITFEHASTNAIMLGGSHVQISATQYMALANSDDDLTEANVKLRIKRATSLSNLRLQVSSVTGTWTINIRNNGVSSTNLTIGSITASGGNEDVTGSEAFSAEDDANFNIIEDFSGILSEPLWQIDIDTSDSWWGAGLQNNITTRVYKPFSMKGGNNTADDNYTAHIGSVTAGNLQTFVTTGGSGTRDMKLRVASTDSTNLNISITGTGLFEDTTGSEAVADTENVTASMASTSAVVRVSRIAVELPFSTVETDTGEAQPFPNEAPGAFSRRLLTLSYLMAADD